jgi:hypothetical protein
MTINEISARSISPEEPKFVGAGPTADAVGVKKPIANKVPKIKRFASIVAPCASEITQLSRRLSGKEHHNLARAC